MAVPYDSIDSPFSKDFKMPSDIRGHEVFVRIMDTKDLKPPKGIDKLCVARDLLAKEFIESACEKMIFIDSDTICEGKDLIHLIENEDEVCGNVIFPRWDMPKGFMIKEKTKVNYANTACMAISRSVFEKLKPPYFRYKDYDCFHQENIQFCRNCKDAEISQYKYPHVVGHQDRKTGEVYREYREVYP